VSSRQPTLLLHVGAPRTATASVHAALNAVGDRLRRRGVVVVDGAALAPALRAARQRDVADVIRGEVERAGGANAETIVVSTPCLLGDAPIGPADTERFRPDLEAIFDQVVAAVGPGEVRVALVTRRQDRLIESAYAGEVQRGAHHGWQDQFPFLDVPRLSFCDLADRLRAAGATSVRVRPYEVAGAGRHAVLLEVLRSLGLPIDVDPDALRRHLGRNHGYSAMALRLALVMNPLLDTERERRWVREFLRREFGCPPYEPARFLTDDERASILEIYRSDNQRLFREHMSDLPPSSYESDSATDDLARYALRPKARRARRAGRVLVRGARRRLRRVRRLAPRARAAGSSPRGDP
jgi:hypothetical protein